MGQVSRHVAVLRLSSSVLLFFLLSFSHSIYLSVYLSIYLSVYLSIHFFIHLSIYLYISLHLSTSLYISRYLYIYLSRSFFPSGGGSFSLYPVPAKVQKGRKKSESRAPNLCTLRVCRRTHCNTRKRESRQLSHSQCSRERGLRAAHGESRFVLLTRCASLVC